MEDESTKAVRPLDIIPPSEPPAAPTVPIVARVIVLLTAGVLIGWLFGSMTRSDAEQIEAVSSTNAPVTSTTTSTLGVADIDWQAAVALPAPPDGFVPFFILGAVELEDVLYVHAMSLIEGAGFEVTSSALWESSDGVIWRDITPDLGDAAIITDIDVYERGLLLSGAADGRVQLWRSQPDRAIGPDGWIPIDLGPAGNLSSLFRGISVSSAVNVDDEIVTAALLPLDVAAQVLDPLLPAGISLSDPRYMLEPPDGAVVRDVETREIVLDLDEEPEIVAHGNEVWARIVDPDGAELLTIVPLDPGARLAFGGETDLFFLPSEKIWQSSDGVSFDLVAFDDRADSGMLSPPTGFRSGFVGATMGENDRMELWTSVSGGRWSPLDWTVPDDCSRGFGFPAIAVSGEHLLLPGRAVGQACEVNNGTWTVVTVHSPTNGVFSSVSGGDAGFAMVMSGNPGSAPAIAVSRDGRQWQSVAAPTDNGFANIFFAGDRLILVSTSDGTGGAGFDVHVGTMDR